MKNLPVEQAALTRRLKWLFKEIFVDKSKYYPNFGNTHPEWNFRFD